MQLASGFFLTGCVFGFFLNIIVAIAMTFNKNAKNGTYRSMVQLAVSDAGQLAGIFIQMAVYTFSSIANQPVSWLISEVAIETYTCCSECFLVLVAFTRLLHFANPGFSQSTSAGNRYLLIICGIWIGAFAIYAPALFGFKIFDSLPDGTYPYMNTTYATVIKYFDPGVAISSLILQVAFNLATFFYILSLRKIIVSPELKKKQRREIKLFVQCAIDSLIFIINKVLIWICFRINEQTCPVWVSHIVVMFIYLNVVDCAILNLCFNGQLRQTMVKFVKDKVICHCHSGTTPVQNLVRVVNK